MQRCDWWTAVSRRMRSACFHSAGLGSERCEGLPLNRCVLVLMEDLEEDLTCSVCFGLFSDPRVLPCSHTFCRSCLESVLQASVSFSVWRPLRLPLKCPSCRSVAELPPSGLDALPVNVCLRAIVEKYQSDGRPRAPACPEHPRQPLNVYCVQDRKLICGFCLTVGQHQGHAIDDLQTALEKERGARGRLTEGLRGQRWEELCSVSERLQQERARGLALLQSDREAVSSFFQDLDLILAQKEEHFTQALDRARALLEHAYEPLVQQVKALQEEHSELESLSAGAESEECPLAYLETVHQLRERVEALLRTPLPEAPSLQVAPRADRFFQEHWGDVSRALRDAPVPQTSCHSASPPGAPAAARPRGRPSAPALVLLLLVAAGLSGLLHASAELSQLQQVDQLLCCLLHSVNTTLSTFLSALGEYSWR